MVARYTRALSGEIAVEEFQGTGANSILEYLEIIIFYLA